MTLPFIFDKFVLNSLKFVNLTIKGHSEKKLKFKTSSAKKNRTTHTAGTQKFAQTVTHEKYYDRKNFVSIFIFAHQSFVIAITNERVACPSYRDKQTKKIILIQQRAKQAAKCELKSSRQLLSIELRLRPTGCVESLR